jgi:hypothetical protein
MQRLSSWFEDHLPLRRRTDVRRSDRGSTRKTSKSAAPRLRYTVSAATAAATKNPPPLVITEEEEPFVYPGIYESYVGKGWEQRPKMRIESIIHFCKLLGYFLVKIWSFLVKKCQNWTFFC